MIHAGRSLLGGLLLVAAAPPAAAQDRSAPAEDEPRAEVAEAFDLDIAERRIVERDFHAATDVEAGGRDRGWGLRIGAAVTARRIDARLQGIRGHVRFRGSLARVLEPIPPRGRAPEPIDRPAPPGE